MNVAVRSCTGPTTVVAKNALLDQKLYVRATRMKRETKVQTLETGNERRSKFGRNMIHTSMLAPLYL